MQPQHSFKAEHLAGMTHQELAEAPLRTMGADHETETPERSDVLKNPEAHMVHTAYFTWFCKRRSMHIRAANQPQTPMA